MQFSKKPETEETVLALVVMNGELVVIEQLPRQLGKIVHQRPGDPAAMVEWYELRSGKKLSDEARAQAMRCGKTAQ
jgi:hypothetical protein